MTKNYKPISCTLYNFYEVSILGRKSLRIVWRSARCLDRIETLRPVDLRTRNSAEYMIARNQHGQCRVLRLDRIRSATTLG